MGPLRLGQSIILLKQVNRAVVDKKYIVVKGLGPLPIKVGDLESTAVIVTLINNYV
jgi:hypothetical protein